MRNVQTTSSSRGLLDQIADFLGRDESGDGRFPPSWFYNGRLSHTGAGVCRSRSASLIRAPESSPSLLLCYGSFHVNINWRVARRASRGGVLRLLMRMLVILRIQGGGRERAE